MNRFRFITFRNIILCLVFVALVAALGYYYMQYQKLATAQSTQKNASDQTSKILGDIIKLIYISDTSGAQVAEITDVTKLAGQTFFVHAQNHDYLALFPAAQKAVLYRPSQNIIIETGPFSPNNTATTTQKTATTTQKTSTAQPKANPFSPSQ